MCKGDSKLPPCKPFRHSLRKIMSKMGISVLESYRGAQIFQCIGLDQKVIDRAFTGAALSPA